MEMILKFIKWVLVRLFKIDVKLFNLNNWRTSQKFERLTVINDNKPLAYFFERDIEAENEIYKEYGFFGHQPAPIDPAISNYFRSKEDYESTRSLIVLFQGRLEKVHNLDWNCNSSNYLTKHKLIDHLFIFWIKQAVKRRIYEKTTHWY